MTKAKVKRVILLVLSCGMFVLSIPMMSEAKGAIRISAMRNGSTALKGTENTTIIETSTFDVYANGVTGAINVEFAVWTTAKGKDDLQWYDGDYDTHNNRWAAGIDIENHNGEIGEYCIEAHSYDSKRKDTLLWRKTFKVNPQQLLKGEQYIDVLMDDLGASRVAGTDNQFTMEDFDPITEKAVTTTATINSIRTVKGREVANVREFTEKLTNDAVVEDKMQFVDMNGSDDDDGNGTSAVRNSVNDEVLTSPIVHWIQHLVLLLQTQLNLLKK